MSGGEVTDGDMLNLALGMAGGPLASTATRTAAKEAESLASRGARLYNGPHAERLFSADYPHGYQADAAGNLTLDIDGNPLQIGGRIVGRSVAGGAGQALSPTEFDAIAEAATGRDTAALPQSALGRNVGRVAVNRSSRLPTRVYLSDALTPERNAYFHGSIPMAIKPTQPETSPSTSTETRSRSADELWAEAWLAERTKPSRQQNLTPSQRKVWARLLRELRSSDAAWAVSP